MNDQKVEIEFKRRLRNINESVGFSIPCELVGQLRDQPRGKLWIVTMREA